MSGPQELAGQRDSLIRAQFAPDFRRTDPGDPGRLTLVLDNHDTTTWLVRIELAGPLARYTRPRRQARLELLPRRQHEIPLEIRPEDTRPEGGHAYDLHAVIIDEKTDQIVFTCTARVGVEPAPAITTRSVGATPPVVQGEVPVQLRVHVRNTGNIPLRVDAQRVTMQYWVRDDDRRREELMYAARRAVRNEQSEPRTPERLRPRQTHDFDVIVTPPPYLVGTRPRRWWVPIGVRTEETAAECAFVDFVQRPQWQLEERMVWLGVAVVAALLVLVVFMAMLAT